MKLVNLANGQYIDAIQWTLHNVKEIKKFVDDFVVDNFVDLDAELRCNSFGHLKLHYIPTLNHSLTIYYTVGKNIKHHILTIPADDYLILGVNNVLGYKYFFNTVSKNTINYEFSVPHIIKHHYVGNQSGVHYNCYQWNGSWANLPEHLIENFYCDGAIKINKNHNLCIHFNKTSISANPKSYLMIPISEETDDILDLNNIEIANSNDLKTKYHTPKSVKLPRYVFTVTKTTGEYSDVDTEVIGSASTYHDAEHIIDKACDAYSSLKHPSDMVEDTDPDFNITSTKTRGFNKDDFLY